MKLNTLLLTSAATLMATSVAFAADLPSKKAAPSSGSVQVCKVGGMTGFTLPGSATCLGVSGWVRFDGTYNVSSKLDGDELILSDDGALDWSSWGGVAHVNFDAQSNTEIGVVRSFIGLEGTAAGITADRAYIQFAGITAGRKSSISDVFGTQSDAMTLASTQKEGIDYQVKVGDLNFGIGAEAPNNNTEDDSSADMPDFIAHLSGKVGTVGFAVAAASHQAYDDYSEESTNGWAVKGNVNVEMSGLRLGVFGGMATNASKYTGGWAAADYDADDNSYGKIADYIHESDTESSVWGVTALYTADKLSIGADYAQYNVSNEDDSHMNGLGEIDTTEYAVFAGYQVAKGLKLYTEYHYVDITAADADGVEDTTASGDTSTILFRIQRDF